MSDYRRVQDALAKGAEPAMICATCPWDRLCISPPSMTREQIDDQVRQAAASDQKDKGTAQGDSGAGFPIGTILATLTLAGRDTMAEMCPVFALRLRTGTGRQIADDTKKAMQGWDDSR
jgi:hypothetical protein